MPLTVPFKSFTTINLFDYEEVYCRGQTWINRVTSSKLQSAHQRSFGQMPIHLNIRKTTCAKTLLPLVYSATYINNLVFQDNDSEYKRGYIRQ